MENVRKNGMERERYSFHLKKGLGKYEQGITIPLIGRKTSKNHGVIININNTDN